jgi:RNA polymerase sigma-70 factor (ECF subfamily)
VYNTNTDKLDEQVLISELKKDSQKALNSIYQMYAKRLYAFCLQYNKSTEDAEEAVQDVFVKLWTNRKNIRQEETLRSLLFIMVRHHLINAYRSRLNSPIYEDYVNCQEELTANDPQQHLEYEDFVRQLEDTLKKLPVTQQRIIELSRMQQLNNKEIAIKLSLSEQTVKNQLSLGLKTLREELNKVSIWLWLLFLVNY